MANKISKFFLGESTPGGFKTFFSQQINENGYYTYILKGGPGTGKSTLMKKIALEFSDVDDIDIYLCSGDPHSFDAVVLKNSKTIVVDGTSPHVFDCSYPGVYQSIINLGECWNEKILKEKKDEIKKVTDENSQWHTRCRKYITALASINSDIYTIGNSALNYSKLKDFSGRFIKKNLAKIKDTSGLVSYKKLSALTENGYSTHETENYSRIFLMHDPYFSGADVFLQKISEAAVSRGYDIIISENNLFQEPVFEHILIPEAGIAFISSTYLTDITKEDSKHINFGRFYYKDIISGKKQRIDFSKKAAAELLSEGAASLLNAKKVHDIIEEYYIKAVDFKKINSITNKLISDIKERY